MTGPSDCLRCGYNLHGIADEQPCPECGLLAERSRRPSESLRDARPKWLMSLSMGVWTVLLALTITTVWFVVAESVVTWAYEAYFRMRRMLPNWYSLALAAIAAFGFLLSAVILPLGVWSLTRPEGYEPADRQDRTRRRCVRLASVTPLLALTISLVGEGQYDSNFRYRDVDLWFLTSMAVLTIGTAPLPWLGFAQLRNLAKRAGSGHLYEHCRIVGVGMAGTLLASFPIIMLAVHGEDLGIDFYWLGRSPVWMGVMLAVFTGVGLFWLWAVYVMIRFAISFARASRELRRKWRAADRAGGGH